MGLINLGNQNFELRVEGVDTALEKLNELEKKLIEVKNLIEEVRSMSVNINFFGEQLEDETSDIQHQSSL